MFKKFVFKNGLRLITVFQENTQAVTILVLVKTGSKYEEKETNGISHFLEHMLFKGTKKRPTPVEVSETLDKVGGIYNAFTSYDFTGYFAKVEASQWELALDWVSDIFLNSKLPSKEIEKEKGVINEEINMLYDNPLSHVLLLWYELLYKDQPMGWPIIGRKENIKKIDRKKLLSYLNSQYVSSNTIICVAGKIESDKIVKKIKKYFQNINDKKPKGKQKVFESQKRPESIIYFKETDQTHLCLGVRGYNLFHPKRYAFELLGIILGGMMSSRLFIKIREKLGLAYYIKTDTELDPDTGFLVTQAGVPNTKIKQAISAILDEYKKIGKEKLLDSELQKAKDNTKGKLALLLETSDALASFYASQELLEERILTPDEVFKEIDRVRKDDIIEVARDIFKPSKLNLAIIGPHKDKKKIDSILKL